MVKLKGWDSQITNRSKPCFIETKAVWVTKTELLEVVRVGRSRPLILMNSDDWKEGIHWIRPTGKNLLFNLPLILDWCSNCHDPASHQRAINAYLKSLLSNKTA